MDDIVSSSAAAGDIEHEVNRNQDRDQAKLSKIEKASSIASEESEREKLFDFIDDPETQYFAAVEFELSDDESVRDGDNALKGDCSTDNSRSLATPLYSLSEVEKMVIEGDFNALKSLLSEVQESIETDPNLNPDNEIICLQLGVLELAWLLAHGDFFECIKHRLVYDIISPEGSCLGENKEHSVSRVRNREARFLHERVVRFIDCGLSKAYVDRNFKDPEISSPDKHVNQRSLRAYSVVLLGAACLNLYLQANWTGPPLADADIMELYPLPYSRNIYDNAPEKKDEEKQILKTAYVEKALSSLRADAAAASALSNEEQNLNSMDRFPLLHARNSLMLGANGEQIYHDARYLHYLYSARILLRIACNPTLHPSAVDVVDMLDDARLEDEENEAEILSAVPFKTKEHVPVSVRRALTHLLTSTIWAARSATVHQESLESQNYVASSLSKEAEFGFQRTLKIIESDQQKCGRKPFLARLYLEKGIMYHKFKKPDLAKEAFHHAQRMAGLNVSLSGALGRRTKFQKEEKSQLVLLAASESTVLKPTDAKNDVAQRVYEGSNECWGETIGKEKIRGIHKVALEELDTDTPLHEHVQFESANMDSEERRQREGVLDSLDQCIVLGLCIDVKNSYAMEGLTAEEMAVYVERIVQAPENWMIFSTALFIKSQLEFLRNKTKERSVLQMQVLVDQQHDRLTPLQARQEEIDDSAPVQERLEWLTALAWPALWELKRILAQNYIELGVAGSALQIFEEIRLWEEAVNCLVAMNRHTRAEELARARIEVAPSPNLYCLLGNLTKDFEWYNRAWELSSHRYARAKELLALQSFGEGDYAKTIVHLRDAVRANPFNSDSWFRLGAAAMRIELWQDARKAFAEVTRIDPENGDAWANLSSVLIKIGDSVSALNCIREAARYSSSNWKVWENYISISAENGYWGLVIQGNSALIDLRDHRLDARHQVDIESLVMVTDFLIWQGSGSCEKAVNDPSKKPAENQVSLELLDAWKQQLEELFEKFRNFCKSDADVWQIMAMFYKSTDNREKYRDCLLRRLRRLLQDDGWEKDKSKSAKILSSAETLREIFEADAKTYPEGSETAKDLLTTSSTLLNTTLSRIEWARSELQ